MSTWINTFKADSGEKVLKQYSLIKALSVDQVFPHLSLEISSSQEQHKIISLCVNTRSVTSYVDNSNKTLNKYIAASNIKEIKFRKAEFQQVKIYKIPNNNKTRYKINIAHTEKSILTLFISIVEGLLTGKTLINNDVIKWLPNFNWEMNIVLFYLL
ncbi:hypothetical protein [Nostoc sp.]|uniref:hypothetical protein n=1 Tax=Nostoc sp. TaxID=1180 RepID=UPI002FF86286